MFLLCSFGRPRAPHILPRQGEVARSATEGEDARPSRTVVLPPPPAGLRPATSPWRGRTARAQRGRWVVPMPGVMKIAVQVAPGATSAVCQVPGGLMA